MVLYPYKEDTIEWNFATRTNFDCNNILPLFEWELANHLFVLLIFGLLTGIFFYCNIDEQSNLN